MSESYYLPAENDPLNPETSITDRAINGMLETFLDDRRDFLTPAGVEAFLTAQDVSRKVDIACALWSAENTNNPDFLQKTMELRALHAVRLIEKASLDRPIGGSGWYYEMPTIDKHHFWEMIARKTQTHLTNLVETQYSPDAILPREIRRIGSYAVQPLFRINGSTVTKRTLLDANHNSLHVYFVVGAS